MVQIFPLSRRKINEEKFMHKMGLYVTNFPLSGRKINEEKFMHKMGLYVTNLSTFKKKN